MDRRRGRGRGRLRRLARPGVAAGLLAAGLLLSVAFVGIAIQRNAVARDIAALTADIATEQLRRVGLEAQVAEKSTDAYVTDKSRELGYVRPGEGIIALDVPPRATPAPALSTERPPRVVRWVLLFFGPR